MKFLNSSLLLLTVWFLEPELAFQHNVYHSLMTCVALINEVREPTFLNVKLNEIHSIIVTTTFTFTVIS